MEKDHGFVNQYVMIEQLAILGQQAQQKLTSMKVFVHGITGLGVEIVKNLAMLGVKSVTLHDSSIVTFEDIGRNFTCREEYVGKMTRAEACHLYFNSFRSYCSVNVSKDLTIEYMYLCLYSLSSSNFDMVICVDNYDKKYLIKLNEACRKNNVSFIVSGSLGLYGYMFVDFGQNHIVLNQNGKQSVIQYIDSVKQTESQTQIFYGQYVSWQEQPFKKGDLIELMQFKGMESIKGQIFQVRQVSNKSHSLKIDGTLKYGYYEHSGIVRQVKVPKKIRFESFKETLENLDEKYQSLSQTNNSNRMGTQYQLHLALNGLYEFYAKHNRLPKQLNQEQIDQVVQQILAIGFIWKGRRIEQADVDRKFIGNVAKHARTQIAPMSKFWGGIVSHQLIKWTGIFTPFHQWFHYEFYDTLPEQNQITRILIPESRYSDYIQLFGDDFVRKLQSSKSLLIGAGSLGNEFVEMLAMMGVSSKEGKIIVLDDSDVQQRNLSSHSLFREQHLMTKKSKSLCIEGSKINKQTNFEAIQAKFIDKYEDYFDDDFWQDVDFVINTPDQGKQKNYVDKVCVWYEKPSIQFEMGTNKFNSFVIIPFESQNFSQYTLQVRYSYQYSTINHFPFLTNHAIQYSKNCFQNKFQQLSKQLNQFYKQQDKFISLQIESNLKAYRSHQSLIKKMVKLKKFVEINQSQSFEACVKMLLEMFIDQFDESMKQRLRAYPPDYVTENGRLFWCFRKRLPRPISFQIDDHLHYDFVYHGSWILADMMGIRAQTEHEKVKQIIAQVLKTVEEKVQIPKKNLSEQEQAQQCMKLLTQMKLLQLEKQKTPKKIVSDFSNPKNHQIQFLTAFANLRAKNFRMEEASKLKVMTYASSLNPKLPTITSTLVGSAGIQLIKMIMKKPRQVHKNALISLSEPFISFVTPQPPKLITDSQFDPIMCGPVRALPKPHTNWDKLDIKGPMSVIQFKQHLQNLLKITVEMIYIGGKEIVNFFTFVTFHKKAAQRRRLMMAVEYAVEDALKIPVYKWKRTIQLCICAVDTQGVDVCLPNVRYYFNGK